MLRKYDESKYIAMVRKYDETRWWEAITCSRRATWLCEVGPNIGSIFKIFTEIHAVTKYCEYLPQTLRRTGGGIFAQKNQIYCPSSGDNAFSADEDGFNQI